MKNKIHSWKCPECKKLIESIHENQFNYNKKQHIEMHERADKK